MERRMRLKSHVRCGAGEKVEIISKPYLLLLKSGMTAQGNALGSLVSSVKRTVAGTATLFGGKAFDIYYIMWRLFPHMMNKSGFEYKDIQKWNKEYGNIEKTVYNQNQEEKNYDNKQSRGGKQRVTEKIMPGISPYVLQYLIPKGVWLNLFDVWPEELRVPFLDCPTIFVDMSNELKSMYEGIKKDFESSIDTGHRSKGNRIPNIYPLYTETGISALDNPFKYPSVTGKQLNGEEITIWKPDRTIFNPETSLPKEKKLIELVEREIAENRVSLVYVKDTGSTNEERDLQPRLKAVIEKNNKNAKVAILRTSSCATDRRTEWVEKKVKEGYNVFITSIKLVKIGIDLLATPTLIFYQFCWSMFDMIQAKNRSFRIGQTRECRVFYLAYADTFQQYMAHIIARKNKASQAINGEVTADGLSSMLGDSGDIQKILIDSIKNKDGLAKLKGSAEEWIAGSSDKVIELLTRKAPVPTTVFTQLIQWMKLRNTTQSIIQWIEKKQKIIEQRIINGEVAGFIVENNSIFVDEISAFGFPVYSDADLYQHLLGIQPNNDSTMKIKIVDTSIVTKKRGKAQIIEGQLALEF